MTKIIDLLTVRHWSFYKVTKRLAFTSSLVLSFSPRLGFTVFFSRFYYDVDIKLNRKRAAIFVTHKKFKEYLSKTEYCTI